MSFDITYPQIGNTCIIDGVLTKVKEVIQGPYAAFLINGVHKAAVDTVDLNDSHIEALTGIVVVSKIQEGEYTVEYEGESYQLRHLHNLENLLKYVLKVDVNIQV